MARAVMIGQGPARERGLWAKMLMLLGFVGAFGVIAAIGLYLQSFGWL
jgi:hypothetical protein